MCYWQRYNALESPAEEEHLRLCQVGLGDDSSPKRLRSVTGPSPPPQPEPLRQQTPLTDIFDHPGQLGWGVCWPFLFPIRPSGYGPS